MTGPAARRLDDALQVRPMAVLDVVRTHGVRDQPQHRLADPPTAALLEGALRSGLRSADEVRAAAA